MKILTKSQIADIRQNLDQFHYVNLDQFRPQINRALSLPSIQQAYHTATANFWAVRRWEIIRHFKANYLPKPLQLLEGHDYFLPHQAESLDWRWENIGRPPKYHDYICASACHWMSEANCVLANHLFPEINWSVVANQYHTSVVCLDNNLLFDLNYFGMNVSPKEAAELLIKDSEEDIMFYPNGLDYKSIDLSITGPAVEFWSLIDSRPGTDAEKLALYHRALKGPVLTLQQDVSSTAANLALVAEELSCFES
jgi:hypothetical protein